MMPCDISSAFRAEINPPYFRRLPAPTVQELQGLVQQISARLGRHLERRGLRVRDLQSSHLALESPGTGEAEECALAVSGCSLHAGVAS